MQLLASEAMGPRAKVAPGRWLGRRSVATVVVAVCALSTILDVLRPAFHGGPVTTSAALRVALCIAATAGLYAWIGRTRGRRAAVYAVVVLATTPVWFVQTAGEDTFAMAPTIVLAFLGLAADRDLGTPKRVVSVVVALATSAVAARSIGLAATLLIPALAVGVGRIVEGPLPASRHIAMGVVVLLAIAAGLHVRAPHLLLGPPMARVALLSIVPKVAYGFAPWSVVLPFALVRRPKSPTVLLAVVVLGLAIVPGQGAVVFMGALAAAVGTMLAELDHERRPSPLLALGVIAIGAIIAHDVSLLPERVLDVAGSSLPTGHAGFAARTVRIAVASVTGALAIVALAKWEWLDSASVLSGRSVVLGRGLVTIVVGLVAGSMLRFHAYPSLLARVSPQRAFAAWLERRRAGDELATFAVDARTWPASESSQATPESAATWLIAAPLPSRRFLAIGPTGLARVNAAYRAKRGENIPVITGEGAFLLGVDHLLSGERSDNPLDAILRSSAPPDLRITEAPVRLGAGLDLLGWSVVDGAGRSLGAMPRRASHVRVAVRVRFDDDASTRSLTGHCTFLHIDHAPTRFGAEHRDHTYPMGLWRDGDVFIDDFEVDLPPHFGAGSYPIYWGVGRLPCQDDRRMPITSGPNDGHHRVPLGRLEVR